MGHETNNNPVINLLEKANNDLEPFFNSALKRLNLTSTQIEKQPSEELEISLSTVEDAIRGSASFGVFKVGMSANASFYIAQSKTKHHYEVGILPLLLESKKLILMRLASFGGDVAQTERTMHEQTVAVMTRRIAKFELLTRFLIGFILWLTCLLSIIKLPVLFNWTWLTTHQNVIGLSALSIVIATGLIWVLLDKSKSRRLFALGSIVMAALIGGITIL